MKKYFVILENIKKGPFSLDELLELPIKRDTLIWSEGHEEWEVASQYDEISSIFQTEPPEIPLIVKAKIKKSKQIENVKIFFDYLFVVFIINVVSFLILYSVFDYLKKPEFISPASFKDFKIYIDEQIRYRDLYRPSVTRHYPYKVIPGRKNAFIFVNYCPSSISLEELGAMVNSPEELEDKLYSFVKPIILRKSIIFGLAIGLFVSLIYILFNIYKKNTLKLN